jgi:hypothetical protein
MKQWFLYPLAALIITALLHFFAHLPIGLSALIAFLGWPVVGTVVTSDDELPGGWSNLDGTATPAWETPEFRCRLCGGSAVVSAAFAMQVGASSQWFSLLVASALVCGAGFVYFFRRSRKAHVT